MAHHEPLKALGPIDWADVPQDDLSLGPFLASTFSQAQTVVDSIPTPPNQIKALAQSGRPRSHTDSSVLPPSSSSRASRDHANTTANDTDNKEAAARAAHAAQLLKEWKEVKVPPKDNPMGITVYKMSSKDSRGAWFARRSLHEGISFDKFKLGLEREFGETLKNSTGPGTGNVRGIGADQRAERLGCDGVGIAEVWLLSAQFPGPTTPRDFVTLLLTGTSGGENKKKAGGQGPRQFMIVSKPCGHPECAPRSGYIRGSYESVEIIREVPIEKGPRRTRSSVDLRREDVQLPVRTDGAGDELGKEAVLRSASQKASGEARGSLARSTTMLPQDDSSAKKQPEMRAEMAVEWIMVTRSDPGGSVPRFMVEKGTPGGIVNDAGRFIKWLESKTMDYLENPEEEDAKEEIIKSEGPASVPTGQTQPPAPTNQARQQQQYYNNTNNTLTEDLLPPSGLYSMITGVLGAASSVVAARLPNFAYASGPETETTMDDSDSDDSDRSFASAPEPEPEPDLATPLADKTASLGDLTSVHSNKSDESASKLSAKAQQHEKQLKKLQERYRKLEEKATRQQERNGKGKEGQGEGTGDDPLARLREKHEREVAKQEENYKKELKKLEERRLKEEKKAEERRRKEREKEARNNIGMELERTRVERDMALKQIDILKEQVGELQAQNTQLVARLGKVETLGGKADEGHAGEGGGRGSGDPGSRPPSLRSK